MADKVVIEAEVKSNVGQVGKDAKSAAGEFKIMGVSLNGVKAGFISAGASAKAMFGSIKAGLISTGIGAFLVAIGSLVAYFTSTKKGADLLDRSFKAIGTTIDVLKDRLSDVGEAISLVFQGKWSEAADKLKESVTGIVEEVTKEVKIMDDLEIRLQKLRDAELAFSVQKAATRQEIEKARLIAEDETKSAKERLDNLKKALELEEKTTQRELELAREKVAIQDEQMLTSKNLVEDEARLAQFRVELIEKETASVKMRRRVVTEVNSLEREILAEEKARAKEKQDIIDAENDAIADAKAKKDAEDAKLAKKRKDEAKSLLEIQQQNTLALIDDLTKRAFEELKIQEKKELLSVEGMDNAEQMKLAIQKKYDIKRGKLEDAVKDKQEKDDKAIKDMKIKFAVDTLGAISKIAGEETKIGKAAALAQATVSGTQSVINAFKTASDSPLNALVPGYNFIQAGLAAGFAAKTIKDIASSKPPSAGGGGGGSAAPSTPAPQMMSGAFELGGGVAPEPVKAFVVTDEMSNSQNQLANIRRTATI